MRLAIVITCVLVSSLPSNVVAQRSKTRTSSRQSQQPAPTIRFSFGDSALKIPLDIDNSIIRMQVRVNDSRPLKFIFDTGASVSAISSQRATELGLKAHGQSHVNATGGKLQGSYTKGVSLGVQGAQISNQLIASFPFSTPPGFEFDGIIGSDFISQFVVEIDYLNKIMNLYNPRTYAYSGKGEVIPLLLAAGRTPLVNTKIILKGRAPIEARLEVDTGADGTFVINSPLVKKQKLAEAILKTSQSNINGAGGQQKLLYGPVKAVQLGHLVFDNPPVGLSQDTEGAGASEENDGLIGGEIFRRFKVILDYSHQRMILKPNKNFNDPYDLEEE